jgi:exodeoxyribonuclease-5
MDLSPQQEAARLKVLEWFENKDSDPVFRLFGYAGTGKTTIAKTLAEGIDGSSQFMAFTGKAALVLREKGCGGATTTPSMIYTPKIKSMAHLVELNVLLQKTSDAGMKADIQEKIAKEKDNLRRPAFNLNLESPLNSCDLILLDEVSMVGTQIAEDLLSFNTKILALGDPAQLPPIGEGGFFTACEPDFMLTEIHRQAEGSPIIQLATAVRERRPLTQGTYGDSRVIRKGVLSIQELAAHDQIIVGKNRTRQAINARIRKEVKLFDTHLPVAGDLLICLKNDKETGLLNGSQWEVQACEVLDSDQLMLTIRGQGEEAYPFQVTAWRHYFEGREKDIAPYEMTQAQHFDYGYAITCHKSQGSQWKNIAVVDESECFRADAARWLYTAITRASERITVIQ